MRLHFKLLAGRTTPYANHGLASLVARTRFEILKVNRLLSSMQAQVPRECMRQQRLRLTSEDRRSDAKLAMQ